MTKVLMVRYTGESPVIDEIAEFSSVGGVTYIDKWVKGSIPLTPHFRIQKCSKFTNKEKREWV